MCGADQTGCATDSKRFLSNVIKMGIGNALTLTDAKTTDIFLDKPGNVRGLLRVDVSEVYFLHIIEREGRTPFLFQKTNRDVIELNPPGMPHKKSIGWKFAEH